MLRRWLRSLFRFGSEASVSLGLVVACFALFLGLLTLTFPEGTSLRSLIKNEDAASLRESLGFRDMKFLLGSRETDIAVLSSMSNRVKDKESSGIAWKDSETGKPLGERHSIQTFARSTATIAFDQKNRLQLGPHSLVVLKSFDREDDGSDRRASLIMLGGNLRGQLSGSDTDSLQVEVETSLGIATIRSADEADEPAVFQVRVNQDKTSTIAVEQGVAEITTSTGSLVVGPDQMVALSEDAEPTIVELPEAPALRSPGRKITRSYRSQPPQIGFRWAKQNRSDGYRMVIAQDPNFEHVVHETHVEGEAFTLGSLGAGTYYWRVATTRGTVVGAPSETRRLRLVQDLEAPSIRIAWPEGTVREKSFVLTGHTEPNSQVFIANNRVEVSESGDFSHEIKLGRGMNIVVVEALDGVGNSAYRSKTLNVQY